LAQGVKLKRSKPNRFVLALPFPVINLAQHFLLLCYTLQLIFSNGALLI